jgi:signal transduction histidine kinase
MARPPKGSIPIPGLRWRGLNLQFFSLFFVPLIGILLLITFGSLTIHQRAMRQLVGERDERAARTAASALSEQINHRAAAVRGLALRASDHIPPAEILTSSQFLHPDFDFGLAFFAADGQILAVTNEPEWWQGYSEEVSNLQKNAISDPDANAVFSVPLKKNNQDDFVVFVAAAISGDTPVAIGAFSPVVLARQTLAGAFAPSISTTNSPSEQSAAFVVSQDHQIIYQIGQFLPSESSSDHPGIAEALRGESGTTYFQIEGSEHVVAFSPVQLVNWALVIEEPWESVANPILNTTQLAPLVLVPVLLLSTLALWFGARQIVRPLQELESRSADLAWGNFNTIAEPIEGIDEVQRLHQTLTHLAHKIKRSQEGLRGYIGAITTGQEDERLRLARELHDGTIQALIALNQRIQLSRLQVSDNSKLENSLDEIHNLTEQTIGDVRRFVRALRPLYMEDLGLVAALEMLARESSTVESFQIEFQHTGTEKRLSPQTELALYRIAQEGISNIFRHAQADQGWLNLIFATDEIRLTIQDNGQGFDVPESPAEFAPGGHYGLLGIHERAELIGGRLKIASDRDLGTKLEISVPK